MLQKIELSREYPCPCYRRGKILPIALTEALGCDRCQQVFLLENQGYSLRSIVSHSFQQEEWQWTGQRWQRTLPHRWGAPWSIVVLATLVVPILCLVVVGDIAVGLSAPALMALILLVGLLPFVLVWFTYRRS